MFALLIFCIGNFAFGQQVNSVAEPKETPITVSARKASRWKQGDYDVWHLKEQVEIVQGLTRLSAHEAIIWYEHPDTARGLPSKIIVYAEGKSSEPRNLSQAAAALTPAILNPQEDNSPESNVQLRRQRGGQPHAATGLAEDLETSPNWLGRFYSTFGVQFNTPIVGPSPATVPAIFDRGLALRKQEAATVSTGLVQFQQPVEPWQIPPAEAMPNGGVIQGLPPNQQTLPAPQPAPSLASTRIDFKPRSGNPLNVRTFPSPDGTENILLYTGGVRVTIEGQRVQQFQGQLADSGAGSGRVVIEADTVIAWTNPLRQLMGNQGDSSAKRWEVYLEGNIVFSNR